MTAVRPQPANTERGSGSPRGSGSGSGRSNASRPARLVRANAGRHLGPVPLAPLVVWQFVGVLVLAGASWGGLWLFAGGVILVALAVLTLIPRRGRTLLGWLRVWVAFRRRGARARSTQHEPVLGPIREWLPDVELSTIDGRRGSQIGVIFDGTAYTLVLGPDHEELITSANPDTIPLHALAQLGEVEGVRLVSAQLLVRTVGAPVPMLGTYAPQVSAAYSEINTEYTPALASWWIALRLEPAQSADSFDYELASGEAVARALRKVLGWSTKVLASSGLPARALDEAGVREVMALTVGVDPAAAPPGPAQRRSKEAWTSWTADSTTHVTGWITRFPRRGLRAMSTVWSAMSTLPVNSATASLILAWTPSKELQCTGYVRVSAADRRSAQQALTQLRRHVARTKVGLARLDGEQLPGVVATVPLGGGLR